VFGKKNRYQEASAAIEEAIRLDPDDADYFSLKAAILLAERKWPAALEAAENGLRVDPEHVNCVNVRAMALVQLGRRDEAGATIGEALRHEPDNALSHANQGWALLHQGSRARPSNISARPCAWIRSWNGRNAALSRP